MKNKLEEKLETFLYRKKDGEPFVTTRKLSDFDMSNNGLELPAEYGWACGSKEWVDDTQEAIESLMSTMYGDSALEKLKNLSYLITDLIDKNTKK